MFAQQKRARALSLDDDIEEITSLPGAPLKRIRTDPPARSGEEIELSSSDELADEEEEPVPEQVKELVDEGLRLCLVPTIRQRGGVGQGQGQEDGEIACHEVLSAIIQEADIPMPSACFVALAAVAEIQLSWEHSQSEDTFQ
ncbi:hypothetical protein B0H10DRAFT_1945750 [Mycena sp. CBHHK59/15]|nr:hypothetical protein B0H10DRAFT_1953436 [Mycena sp. CBHHK59/15]KAJ6620928.1 hypothetical protein B0H10DRAFT_1945750 [Mycena sp. CBHHK59/15]